MLVTLDPVIVFICYTLFTLTNCDLSWKSTFKSRDDIAPLSSKVLEDEEAEPAQDPCKPQQVHLSFGDTVDEVNVVWATLAKCDSKVHYGAHPWGLELVAVSQYTNFIENNEKGAQHLYRAKLQRLLPETTYYYIPISNQISSGPFYFETIKTGNDWSPDFLMFGDMGIHTNSIPSLVSEALTGNYTALFHVGDFGYDLKHQGGLLGDYFMKLIEPVASSIPYMTCPGNHEIDSHSFSHYRHRFAMPNSMWPIPIPKMWYSFDIGLVHFVSYSSEVFFTNMGDFVRDQREWLVSDLMEANKNREERPWIVAFGHRPLYCSTQIGDDCSKPYSFVREGLEDIFYHMSVDIVVQAHEHNYERLWPVYKDKVLSHSYVDPPGPVQIITGAAGSTEKTDHFIPLYSPEWSAFRLDVPALNSYGRLLVVNLTHAFWEQRSIENHTTLDSIWIVKHRNFSLKVSASSINSINSSVSMFSPNISQDIVDSLRNPGVKYFWYQILAGSVIGSCIILAIMILSVRQCFARKRKNNFVKEWSKTGEGLKNVSLVPEDSSDEDDDDYDL